MSLAASGRSAVFDRGYEGLLHERPDHSVPGIPMVESDAGRFAESTESDRSPPELPSRAIRPQGRRGLSRQTPRPQQDIHADRSASTDPPLGRRPFSTDVASRSTPIKCDPGSPRESRVAAPWTARLELHRTKLEPHRTTRAARYGSSPKRGQPRRVPATNERSPTSRGFGKQGLREPGDTYFLARSNIIGGSLLDDRVRNGNGYGQTAYRHRENACRLLAWSSGFHARELHGALHGARRRPEGKGRFAGSSPREQPRLEASSPFFEAFPNRHPKRPRGGMEERWLSRSSD